MHKGHHTLRCLDLDEPGCVDPEDTCFTNEGCASPPEGLCDEDTAISYPAQGNCQGAKDGKPGICTYLQEFTTCADDQLCIEAFTGGERDRDRILADVDIACRFLEFPMEFQSTYT